MNAESVFASPVFENPEQTRLAKLLYAILLYTILLSAAFAAIGMLLLPSNTIRWLVFVAGVSLASATSLALTRKGRIRLASILFLFQFWLIMSVLSITGGGTTAPGFIGFVFVVLSAGLLLGVRAGLLVALLCTMTEIAIAYAEMHGLLPPSMVRHTTYSLIMAHSFFFVYVVVFVYLYTSGLQTALQQVRQELAERQRAEKENQKTLYELGERVKELTAVHTAAHVLQREEHNLATVLHDLVKLLPPAFQFPEVTEARVRVGAIEAKTRGFDESFTMLRSEFTTSEGAEGAIEVVYTEERPPSHEGPFLREERSLLTTLADLLRTSYDRRKATAALRESEAQLRFFANATFEGIGISEAGRLVEANEQFAGMLGYSVSEMIGKPVADFAAPESREVIARSIQMQIEEPYEVIGLRKDGTKFPAEILGKPSVYQGKPARITVIRDLTQRKHLEEQVRRTQRLDSLGTLAGGIAHDLNNVLAPILLSVEVLNKRLNDLSLKKMVDSLGKSAFRGKEIVKQVLTFARGSGQAFSPQNVRYLIREIESFIQHSLPKNISLQVKIPSSLHAVQGDSTQIHQILLNLCVNARDAMPEGGKLVISAENILIDGSDSATLTEAKAGEYVRIAVSDSGTGIPPEIKEKIFEPFFTTKEIGKGTGLGLSTVHSIVRDHKGFMKVTSEVGTGTEFQIYLPAIASGEPAPEKEKEKVLPSGNGERILVIDDELSVLHIARETLEAYGYQVLTAMDGAEALTILAGERKGSVALVLTNIYMPRVDGIETINLLRRYDPEIKIIVTSGLLEEEPSPEISGLHVQGYLTKPYTSELLLNTLSEILHRQSGRE